jgi:uncharacterized protein with ParB-like and HNH nuclease domain
MSRLIDNSISIYEALQNIKEGKYVMPAFQRQYVWSMEQVEKLWDSILLDYPVVPRILCILQMSDNFNMVPQGKVHPCPISLQ